MMDHPNIAKVLDAGLTDQQRPYFVMEYIKGLPLTKYCDDAKLSIAERLSLFIQICQAVQHAHQKGVIHRDLKPGNILIALYDGKPVPKIIDFGLAKALHHSLTEHTLHTGHEMVLGTPLYMSPEQAELNNLDIDTRSDIYSLGVILYELLTGVTPLEKQRFKEAAWAEVLRIIKEEEPSKPSTKLSQSNSLPSVAAQRQMEPKKLSTLVKGDLDWIVMKALEKDRSRRYETANGFAADVMRYLSGDVVTAVPPSMGYRVRKFVARNKGKVLAASLVLLALVVGMAGTTWGMIRATQSAEAERVAKQDAEEQKQAAFAATEQERQAKLESEAKRQEAERNVNYARKGNELLGSVFKGLDPKNNYANVGELRTVLKDNLAKAVKELEGSAIGDPLVVAEMQGTLARSLVGLGEAGQSITLFEKAYATQLAKLGPNHRDTIASMGNLGSEYINVGKQDRGLPLLEKAAELQKKKFGADHSETLICMANLASAYQSLGKLDLALPLIEDTYKRQKGKYGLDDPNTLDFMGNLAGTYQKAGKWDLALPLYEELVPLCKAKLGPIHPSTLGSISELAGVYQALGKFSLASQKLEELLTVVKDNLGPDHPLTLSTMSLLAQVYEDSGKLDLALPLYEKTLQLVKAKNGDDHPTTLASMNNLAQGYRSAGKMDLALPLLEKAFILHKARYGADHPDTLIGMMNLAYLYEVTNKLDLALPLYEKTLKMMTEKQGADHPNTLFCMSHLVDTYRLSQKLDLALPLAEKTFKVMMSKLGPDHPQTLIAMEKFGDLLQLAGKDVQALSILQEAYDLQKAKSGPDDPVTLISLNNLASYYWTAKQLDKSIPLFEEAVKRYEAKLGRNHKQTQRSLANLGVNYKDAGRHKEAILLLEEAHRAVIKYSDLGWVREQLVDAYSKAGENVKLTDLLLEQLTEAHSTLPKESPQLAGQLAQIGMAMLHQKQPKEAEPLLRESLAIREKTQADVWTTFNTQSMLGGALLGQKKFAEAEPFLLKGYEGMKQREKTPTADASRLSLLQRLTEALDRLIQFYTETNQPDEVKKWQAEKAKIAITPSSK